MLRRACHASLRRHQGQHLSNPVILGSSKIIGNSIHRNDAQEVKRLCHSRDGPCADRINYQYQHQQQHVPSSTTLASVISLETSRPIYTMHQQTLLPKINTQLNITRRSMSTSTKPKKEPGPKPDTEKIDGSIIATILASTAVAAYVISPENIEKMKSSKNEYSEVEVEDDIYNRIKDVSDEVRGEITRKILGKELADMMEAERKTAVNTADVVADVLNSDALQNAIASLITRVISSEQFQNACQTLLKNLWTDLVNDPETLAQIVALLNTAIKDEKIKKSFKELVLGLLQDDDVYKELTGLVVTLGEDKEVLDATKELLTESAHQALNDPEIMDHSMEFATDIVGDNVIQRTSGEALRNTVTYAVRPSLSTFLSVFGVALLFFSASALGQARMAAGNGSEMDAAASMIFQNVGESAWNSIVKVFAIPSNAVVAAASALSNILLAPFTFAGDMLISIGHAGNSGIEFLQSLFFRIIASPGMMKAALKNSLISMQGSGVNALHAAFLYVSNLPGLLLTQMRGGIVALGANAGLATASAGRAVYSSLTAQTAEFFGLCRSGVAAGVMRSSASFDIILKHTAAYWRRQAISLNDASEKVVATIVTTISELLGLRSKKGSAL